MKSMTNMAPVRRTINATNEQEMANELNSFSIAGLKDLYQGIFIIIIIIIPKEAI